MCQIPGYRHFLVNSIACLKALDNYIITDEERIEDASFGYRFRGLNEFMKIHIPDYSSERSAEQHLLNLEVDVYRLKRLFERNSPSILIQSWWRGIRSRTNSKQNDAKSLAAALKIQGWWRAVLARRSYIEELRALLKLTNDEDLLLTNEEIERRDKGRLIFKHWYAYYKRKKKERIELAATLKIQTFMRMRYVKNTSFISALKLVEFPKIYFLKEQKPQFLKILKKLVGNF